MDIGKMEFIILMRMIRKKLLTPQKYNQSGMLEGVVP